MNRKTVVLERMELSDNNPAGRLRMTDKVLETKSFDEKNAEQILQDGALSKSWRRKAVQPKEFNPTVVKTLVKEMQDETEIVKPAIDKATKIIEIVSIIRSSEDIGYLQSLLNDSRESVVAAAKSRLKKLS